MLSLIALTIADEPIVDKGIEKGAQAWQKLDKECLAKGTIATTVLVFVDHIFQQYGRKALGIKWCLERNVSAGLFKNPCCFPGELCLTWTLTRRAQYMLTVKWEFRIESCCDFNKIPERPCRSMWRRAISQAKRKAPEYRAGMADDLRRHLRTDREFGMKRTKGYDKSVKRIAELENFREDGSSPTPELTPEEKDNNDPSRLMFSAVSEVKNKLGHYFLGQDKTHPGGSAVNSPERVRMRFGGHI